MSPFSNGTFPRRIICNVVRQKTGDRTRSGLVSDGQEKRHGIYSRCRFFF
jgi:hypothetical protein